MYQTRVVYIHACRMKKSRYIDHHLSLCYGFFVVLSVVLIFFIIIAVVMIFFMSVYVDFRIKEIIGVMRVEGVNAGSKSRKTRNRPGETPNIFACAPKNILGSL